MNLSSTIKLAARRVNISPLGPNIPQTLTIEKATESILYSAFPFSSL